MISRMADLASSKARTVSGTATHPEVPVPWDWCQTTRLVTADAAVQKPNRGLGLNSSNS